MNSESLFDSEVRHVIYTTFKEKTKPPTTEYVANLLHKNIALIEKSFVRLADSHHIVLAPGATLSGWHTHFQRFQPTLLLKLVQKNTVPTEFGISLVSLQFCKKMP